jgi:pimeloyl-ACP methyl ester carboxylesterase
MALYVRDQPGLHGETTLLLLHGLGSNGAVWDRMLGALAGRWKGRVLVPDLRGHGRSEPGSEYALGRHAADVADFLGHEEPVSIVGHSMGGAIGVALASGWYAVNVQNVLGLSIKPAFTQDELDKARAVAEKPRRTFATREEAIERFLLVNGLNGIVTPADEVAARGIRYDADGYTLAADPRVLLAAGPPLVPMLIAATAPVVLATGDRDDIATADDLRKCAGNVAVIAGAGHNVHVERADFIAELALTTLLEGSLR